MSLELLFKRAAAGTQPVDLRFGRIGGGTPPPPPPPPPPDPRAGAIRASVGVPWRSASPLPTRPAPAPWRPAQPVAQAWVAPWGRSGTVGAAAALPWGSAITRATSTVLPWATTGRVGGSTTLPWDVSSTVAGRVQTWWRGGQRVAPAWALPWQGGKRTVPAWLMPWRHGLARRHLVQAGATAGRRVAPAWVLPWDRGTPIESIGGPWRPPWEPQPPEPGCWTPEAGDSVDLLFKHQALGLANLIFACRRTALRVIPVRRVYMVTNVTSLIRVSDGANIPCLGFSLSLDVESFTWGFSASVAADQLELLEPAEPGEPIELAAWVNGTEFRVLAESLGREVTFGRASVRVQGRGAAAVLDNPYQPVTVFSSPSAATSQQLAEAALPFGWTVDWGLDAWLVPGGVWSHQGTPVSALRAIAQAAGGYIQADASDQVLQVLPRYPVAPWSWGTVSPDLDLPSSVVVREGIEWVERPRYNGVYVSGTTSDGVLRLVKRLDTAGDVLATMVTDQLITHDDAARQRGLAVLADTGRQAMVTLRLPVLDASGVIRPGQFVRYSTGSSVRLGLVRSVSVDVQGHQVSQTIVVETHVG